MSMGMSTRDAALGGFFIRAIAGFLVAMALWVPLSPWTSHPVAAITHIVLGNTAPDWVRAIHKSPGRLEVDTRIRVAAAESAASNQIAELVVEAKPARYGYGLPLLLALLFAARSRRWLPKALGAYALLLIPQSFSLTFDVLRQIMVAAVAGALGVAQWRLEAIALGYQIGALLLPTLAPVALWLWLDRRFFAAVIVDGWLRRQGRV